MKFVMLKGVQGWGDRLQCLLQAIQYAKATGRYLVVDWRDSDWTHDPTFPLHNYFTMEGVRTFSLKDFITFCEHYGGTLSVYPEEWELHLLRADYTTFIYKKMFYHDGAGERIHAIATYEEPDFEADIVVYPGNGMRGFAYTDLNHLQPSRWVESYIRDSFAEFGLVPGEYVAVHLRGGSKKWHGGDVQLEKLDKEIHDKWPSEAAYFEHLDSQINPDDMDGDIVVLSDSRALAESWVDYCGGGRILGNAADKTFVASGTHKMNAQQLGAIAPTLTKEQLNLELLRDFTILTNAKQVVFDGVSVFSKMAEKCRLSDAKFLDLGKSNARA